MQYPPPLPMGGYPALRIVGRPGILTAIGVISIIIASMTLLGSLFMVFMTGILQATMNVRFGLPVSPIVIPDATLSPDGMGDQQSPRGLGAEDRKIVILGLSSIRPLTFARQNQIDQLLREAGMDLFPAMAGSPLTTARVAASVSESGRTLGARETSGWDYFVVGHGRLEVSDHHAVFRFEDGRAAIRVQHTPGAPRFSPTPVPSRPGGPVTVPSPRARGSAAVPAPVQVAPMVGLALPWGLALGETAASVALAVLLLIAGILILRQHRLGRRFHLIFAWLKILLAISAGLAWGLLWSGILSQGGGPGGSSVRPESAIGIASVILFFTGATYPIALIIALRSRTVRDYYVGITVETA